MPALLAVLDRLPPLAAPKRPGLAALIGAITGGVGLAVYFRSFKDLLPVEASALIVMVVSLIAGVPPLHVGEVVVPVVGALYGFFRARSSNRRLAGAVGRAVAVAATG